MKINRKMKNIINGETYEVAEHIIIKNFWEYYVINSEHNTEEIKLCIVLGYATEIGDVSMEEIGPYIMSRTRDLMGILPPQDYDWLD